MSFFAFLMFAQVAAAPATLPPLPTFAQPPSKAVAEEIVVIGRKMKTWQGGLYNSDGKLGCRIKASTGDADVDAIRCGAMLRCFAPEVGEMNRLATLDVPQAERNRLMQAHAETLTPCLEAAHDAGMRYLAEARAGAK